MKRYVIGLMRFEDQIVVLKKAKPDWQKDKYNLPGGHIEDGETSLQAMIREWEEEVKMQTHPSDWHECLRIVCPGQYTLDVFYYSAARMWNIGHNHIEPVMWYPLHDLHKLPLVSDTDWIIKMCLSEAVRFPQIIQVTR